MSLALRMFPAGRASTDTDMHSLPCNFMRSTMSTHLDVDNQGSLNAGALAELLEQRLIGLHLLAHGGSDLDSVLALCTDRIHHDCPDDLQHRDSRHSVACVAPLSAQSTQQWGVRALRA
jgi:hypothetical protein